MHTEKQKIFDEYAKNIDPKPLQMGAGDLVIEDWEDLLLAFRYAKLSLPDVKRIIFEACDLVQKAQQDRIATGIKHTDTVQTILDEHKENIGTMDDLDDRKARKKEIKEFQSFLAAVSSIKSENNLIK